MMDMMKIMVMMIKRLMFVSLCVLKINFFCVCVCVCVERIWVVVASCLLLFIKVCVCIYMCAFCTGVRCTLLSLDENEKRKENERIYLELFAWA